MSAYIDEYKENPTAISYFQKQHPQLVAEASDVTGEIYFYLTRRPHIHNDKEVGLISIGGPEKKLEERDQYNREDFCDPWAENLIDSFMKKNYIRHKKESIDYDFCWHGLVGYTSNGIRMVGEEPNNPVLLYNLGCNAVGIMPSIYGSKRIAQILNGEKLPKSIFDPKLHDQSE
jgi:glycine/D-amino acid oxidase-like deaminating enzyme